MTYLSFAQAVLPAWQGWIRTNPASAGKPPDHDLLDLGRAVFTLPDPAEASTTSWMVAEGRFVVFTGYLYNHGELGRALGTDPAPTSHAHLVLEAYRRWGHYVLNKLEGSFALAIWDATCETLLCGRDAVGLHPLFYSVIGKELVFSWDLEAVRGHPGVTSDFNRVALAEHLLHHWWNPHETCFQAIRRLPAGHGLRFVGGRHEVFRYWNPLPASGIRWVNRDELAEFPRLFQTTVAGSMEQGNGHVGIFLSGGLDSISVAAVAAEVAAGRGWPAPHALSLVLPEGDSEEPIQRAVAQQLRLEQSFLHVSEYRKEPGMLRRALELAPVSPGPVTFAYAAPFLDLVAAAKKSGCQVILTGDGGDEMLGTAPIYAADLIRAGEWGRLIRMVGMLIRYWQGPAALAVTSTVWRSGIRAILRDWLWKRAPGLALRRRRQLVPKFLPVWSVPDPQLRRELISRFEEKWDRPADSSSFYVTSTDRWIQHPLPQMLFEEQFYRHARAGMPLQHPYWHRPIVEFLLRTPPELLTEGGRWKSIVRDSVAKRFPGLGFEHQKKSLAASSAKRLLQREGSGIWEALGPARAMAALGLIDLSRYHAMLERCPRSENSFELYRPWHGAGIEAWIRARM